MQLNDLIKPFQFFETSLQEIAASINANNSNASIIRNNIFYNGIIISLYGSFERFIDNLSALYLDFVFGSEPKTEHYLDSEKIKSQLENIYKTNLCDFLVNPKRHTNIDSSNESINQILASYLNMRRQKDYSTIKKELLLIHGGNMRSDILYSFFNNLQIQNLNIAVCEFGPFKAFLINELGFDEVVLGQLKSEKNCDLYLQLNRLVEERNIIAHSAKSENKISFDELLNKTIPFLLLFADAISRSIIENLCNLFKFESKHVFSNPRINIIYDDTIICHNNENFIINVGDYFGVLVGENHKIVKIKSIQQNKKDLLSTLADNYAYGFKIDRKVKKDNLLVFVL